MKKIAFFLCLGLILACNNEQAKLAEEFNLKMDKAIEAHDEVMPKMGKIGKLINALETEIDSLNRDTYEAAMKDLQMGHTKMMTWMKDFGNDFTPQEIQDGLQTTNLDSIKFKMKLIEKNYLSAEDMKTHINTAIENAENLLK